MLYLGRKATDKITGFKGIITGFCAYLTGCNQYLVTPAAKNGREPGESRWIDEQRLTIDLKTKAIVLDNGATPGFDKPAPIR